MLRPFFQSQVVCGAWCWQVPAQPTLLKLTSAASFGRTFETCFGTAVPTIQRYAGLHTGLSSGTRVEVRASLLCSS